MDISILIYEGFTALDVTGPFEVLSRLPDARVRFVAATPGTVTADLSAFALVADPLADMPRPDVIVVSGGSTTQRYLEDDAILSWLRTAHETATWTTSVCTGSLLLGAAGLLEGRPATTHWYEKESLRCFGALPSDDRVVVDGTIATAAGVSAGIDMALTLCDRLVGPTYTQAIQLNLEYDPQPPYDSGSVAKAPAEVHRMIHDNMAAHYGPTWAERQASPTSQP